MKKLNRKLPRPFIIVCAKCYEEEGRSGSVDYMVKRESPTITSMFFDCSDCGATWKMALQAIKDAF